MKPYYERDGWEHMSAAERDAYERERGYAPPGYRGTGQVEWFKRFHPDTAPCCKCGTVTDRWVVGYGYVGFVAWGSVHVDQPHQETHKRAICWDAVWPFCWACERRAAIAVLHQRKHLRLASEVAYLAELEAEETARAAA